MRTVALEAFEHQAVPYVMLHHAGLEPKECAAPCVRFNMLAETPPSQAQDFAPHVPAEFKPG